jgi:hypothetical protein
MRLSPTASLALVLIGLPMAAGAADQSYPSTNSVCTGLRHETVAIFAPDEPAYARSDAAWERERGLYLRDIQQADLEQRHDRLSAAETDMLDRLIAADLDVLYAEVDRVTRDDARAAAHDVERALNELGRARLEAEATPYAVPVASARDALLSARSGGAGATADVYATVRGRLSRVIHDTLCGGDAAG